MRACIARLPPPPRLRLRFIVALTILLVPACLGAPIPEQRTLSKEIMDRDFLPVFNQENAQTTTQSTENNTESPTASTIDPEVATEPVPTVVFLQKEGEDSSGEVKNIAVYLETSNSTTLKVTDTTPQVVDLSSTSTPVQVAPPVPPPVVQVSVSVRSSVSQATTRPDIFTTFLNAFVESAPVATGSPVSAAASRSQLSVDEPIPATGPAVTRQFGARMQFSNRYRPRTFSRSRPRHFSTSQSASEPVAVRLAPSSAFQAARLSRLRQSQSFIAELPPKQPEPRSINYQISNQRYDQHQQKLYHQQSEKGFVQPEKIYAQTEKMYAEPEKMFSEPEKVYGEPEKVYGEPEKVYGQPEKIYGEPEKVYGEPEKVYGQPEKVYGQPEKVYGEPEKVYGEPEKVYGEPEKVYGQPEKIYNLPAQNYGKSYSQPEQVYGQPEQNYEIPESVNVQSNGKAHGVQPSSMDTTSPQAEGLQVFDTALEAERVAASKKFGYVVEGRNYRKYRVEERTPDGFIVGEYGVVSHDDGQLRGVRYTADSTINPKLIYEALMKFLAL